MDKYFKRIICDIDDTISFTQSRDFSNAIPNIKLINKLNNLYDAGWEIIYLTARGNISCNGDLNKRVAKYERPIIKWFKINNVKYTKLSFKKELATFYIDDKGITPEDFIHINIESLEGKSGANIYKENSTVVKTEKDVNTALNVVEWYKIASSFFNVPQISALIDKTIKMEYIDNDISNMKYTHINEIVNVINVFKNMSASCDASQAVMMKKYIDRLTNHYLHFCKNLTAVQKIKFEMYILKLSKIIPVKSFNHGDFSLDNILFTFDKIFLIDPIYEPDNLIQSWQLDVSKLLHSCSFNNKNILYDYIINMLDLSIDEMNIIKLLEISHVIRLYKYECNESKKKHIIKQMFNMIDVINV